MLEKLVWWGYFAFTLVIYCLICTGWGIGFTAVTQMPGHRWYHLFLVSLTGMGGVGESWDMVKKAWRSRPWAPEKE